MRKICPMNENPQKISQNTINKFKQSIERRKNKDLYRINLENRKWYYFSLFITPPQNLNGWENYNFNIDVISKEEYDSIQYKFTGFIKFKEHLENNQTLLNYLNNNPYICGIAFQARGDNSLINIETKKSMFRNVLNRFGRNYLIKNPDYINRNLQKRYTNHQSFVENKIFENIIKEVFKNLFYSNKEI